MMDRELLQKYARDGDQQAFAELVRMHVDVVYSAARRQTRGDSARAEEVTQQVFVLFASKAKSLGEEVLIGGWLYNAVRLVARDEMRREQRRAHHEQKAAAMAEELRKASAPAKDTVWAEAEEVLDQAMADLDEPTRGLLVLRYFQGNTAGEVARSLGISEEAARKRISRGVEQLRGLFARRGIVVSAAALGEALADHAIVSAPAHLAASAASAATSATVAGASTAFTTGAVIMTAGNAKLIAASLLGLLAIGGAVAGGVAVVQHFAAPQAASAVRVAARGLGSNLATVTGIVRDAAGGAVADAEIQVAAASRIDAIAPAAPNAVVYRSGADGSFSLPRSDGPFEIMIRTLQGFALVSDQRLAQSSDVQLQPWGSVEGRVLLGDEPVANVVVTTFEGSQPRAYSSVRRQAQTRTDADGRFVFPRVPPGEIWVRHRDDRVHQHAYAVVEPGKTSTVTIGGVGRPITGRFLNPPTTQIVWSPTHETFSYEAYLRLRDPIAVNWPQHDEDESPEQWRAKEETLGRTPMGARHKPWLYGRSFSVRADGSFRIEDVPAGSYQLKAHARETDPDIRFLSDVAEGETSVLIAPTAGERSDEAQDIGAVVMRMKIMLRAGDAAPPFEFQTLDGKTRNITDYRGKHLLIIYWHTQAHFKPDVEAYRRIYDSLKDNPRLQMIWLCIEDVKDAAERAESWGIPGTVAMRPYYEIPEKYGPGPVTGCLIDPQGKVVKRVLTSNFGAKFLLKTFASK